MIAYDLLEKINYKVNQLVAYRTDLEKHGVADKWQRALDTLASGTGDCEDYAILKMHYLVKAGCDRSDMRVGYFHDPKGRGHAMLICKGQRKGGFMWRKWIDCEWLLDNRTNFVYRLGETRDVWKYDLVIGDRFDAH